MQKPRKLQTEIVTKIKAANRQTKMSTLRLHNFLERLDKTRTYGTINATFAKFALTASQFGNPKIYFFSFFFLLNIFLNFIKEETILKIYSDDPNLPYKTTKLKALYTRSEIDGLFAKWGVKDTYWRWDPDNNEVFVQFKIVEKIDDVPRQFSAKVEAPAIWDRKTRSKAESINWDISMRVMFWFIKSHLEAAYLLQSSKTVAFLALHRHW